MAPHQPDRVLAAADRHQRGEGLLTAPPAQVDRAGEDTTDRAGHRRVAHRQVTAPSRQPHRISIERPGKLHQRRKLRRPGLNGQLGNPRGAERLPVPPPLVRPARRLGPPPGQRRAQTGRKRFHDQDPLAFGQPVQPPGRCQLTCPVLPEARRNMVRRRSSDKRPRRPTEPEPELANPVLGPVAPVRVAQRPQPGRCLLGDQHGPQPPASGTSRKNNTDAPSVRSTGTVASTSWSPTKTLKKPSANAPKAASTAPRTSTRPAGATPPMCTAPRATPSNSDFSVSTRTRLASSARAPNAATSARTTASMICPAVAGPGGSASSTSCSCIPRRRCPVTVALTQTATVTPGSQTSCTDLTQHDRRPV